MTTMNLKSRLIENLIEITGLAKDQAENLLQQSNWDINIAYQTFQSNGKPKINSHQTKRRESHHSNITTFATLNRMNDSESESDVEMDDARDETSDSDSDYSQLNNDFHEKHDRKNILINGKPMMMKANCEGNKRTKAHEFIGAGRLLGDETGESDSKGETSTRINNDEVRVNVTIWMNGFTIGDNALRSYTDIPGSVFMFALSMGKIPAELRKLYPTNKNIVVNIVTKQSEKCPQISFVGDGQMIGTSENVTIENQNRKPIEIDENQETTSIQVKLINGSRLLIRVNLFHTISDIYAHIRHVDCANVQGSFILASGHPLVNLVDMNKTVDEAELKNSIIFQKK